MFQHLSIQIWVTSAGIWHILTICISLKHQNKSLDTSTLAGILFEPGPVIRINMLNLSHHQNPGFGWVWFDVHISGPSVFLLGFPTSPNPDVPHGAWRINRFESSTWNCLNQWSIKLCWWWSIVLGYCPRNPWKGSLGVEKSTDHQPNIWLVRTLTWPWKTTTWMHVILPIDEKCLGTTVVLECYILLKVDSIVSPSNIWGQEKGP